MCLGLLHGINVKLHIMAVRLEGDPDRRLSLFIQLGGSYQACKGEEICGQVKIDR